MCLAESNLIRAAGHRHAGADSITGGVKNCYLTGAGVERKTPSPAGSKVQSGQAGRSFDAGQFDELPAIEHNNLPAVSLGHVKCAGLRRNGHRYRLRANVQGFNRCQLQRVNYRQRAGVAVGYKSKAAVRGKGQFVVAGPGGELSHHFEANRVDYGDAAGVAGGGVVAHPHIFLVWLKRHAHRVAAGFKVLHHPKLFQIGHRHLIGSGDGHKKLLLVGADGPIVAGLG